jgi:hypothetical protein
MCPSSHLQPTINYGHAFGNPVKVTTEVDFGPLLEDEELAFQYFEYQSRYSREAGYQNMFAVHVLRDLTAKKARVFVAWLNDGKPMLVQAPLSLKSVGLVTAVAVPIVHATRFPLAACDVEYLDGYVIQVGVARRSGLANNFLGGEVYAPIPGTPVHQLEVLGRALQAIATGKLAESALETLLREKGIIKPEL